MGKGKMNQKAAAQKSAQAGKAGKPVQKKGSRAAGKAAVAGRQKRQVRQQKKV